MICHGDIASTKAYNPKIQLEPAKILMNGDERVPVFTGSLVGIARPGKEPSNMQYGDRQRCPRSGRRRAAILDEQFLLGTAKPVTVLQRADEHESQEILTKSFLAWALLRLAAPRHYSSERR